MKTKPKLLNYLAMFFIAIAIGIPLQIMVLYDHTPLEMVAIFAKMPPLNWAILLLAPLAAWTVYSVSALAFLMVPLFVMAVCYNNWFVAELATDFSPLAVGLGTGAFLLVMSTLANHKIIQIFFNPEFRWWQTPARRRAKLPVQLHVFLPNGGYRNAKEVTELETTTFDVSEGGAFVVLPENRNIEPGTTCTIALKLRWLRSIRCRAEVVRNASASGSYPAGVGIRFLGLGWKERKLLHEFALASK